MTSEQRAEFARIAEIAQQHLDSTRLTVQDGTLALQLVEQLAAAISRATGGE